MRPDPDVRTLAGGGGLLEFVRCVFRMLDHDFHAGLFGEFLADLGQAFVALVAIDPDQEGACFGRVRHADGGQVADAGQGGGDQGGFDEAAFRVREGHVNLQYLFLC